MTNVLIIDDDPAHAQHLEQEMNPRGSITIYTATIREAVRKLRSRAVSIDLVVLAIADRSRPWLEILHGLQQAAWQPGIGAFPFFLCVSRLNFGVEFQLQVERMGARFAIE